MKEGCRALIAYSNLKITNHLEMMALLLNFIEHFGTLIAIYLLILLIIQTHEADYQIPKNKQ